tara:strand:+ start:428 stop:589 length:162 start_codon:yes stop_codon:yes gene_type:complete
MSIIDTHRHEASLECRACKARGSIIKLDAVCGKEVVSQRLKASMDLVHDFRAM